VVSMCRKHESSLTLVEVANTQSLRAVNASLRDEGDAHLAKLPERKCEGRMRTADDQYL
jgi:hypothetical protein